VPGYRELPDRKLLAYKSSRLTAHSELTRAGVRRIAMSARLKEIVTSIAKERAMPYAISISPRSNQRHRHYQDSFMVDTTAMQIKDLIRVAARLWNTSDHAAAVEWRYQYRVLGRTLAYLNHASILFHSNQTLNRIRKQRPGRMIAPNRDRPGFNSDLHPRGAKGRFIPNRDRKTGGKG
jgi:hypothetical protein